MDHERRVCSQCMRPVVQLLLDDNSCMGPSYIHEDDRSLICPGSTVMTQLGLPILSEDD